MAADGCVALSERVQGLEGTILCLPASPVCRAIGAALRQAGRWRLLVATTLEQALPLAQMAHPDMVLIGAEWGSAGHDIAATLRAARTDVLIVQVGGTASDPVDLVLDPALPPAQACDILAALLRARFRGGEELRRDQQRFRMAIKGAEVVVFEQDRDLRYSWIDNPALDYRVDEVIGRTDADLFERAEDVAVLTAIKRDVLRSGIGRRAEVPVRQNGKSLVFDLSVEPLRDAEGDICGVICAAVDITGRKETDAALRASEARLQAVLQQIPAAVVILDGPDDRVVMQSRHTPMVFGESAPNLAGQSMPWNRAEHPDGRPYAPDEYPAWRALHLGESCFGTPMRYRRRDDGRLLDLEIHAAPVFVPGSTEIAAAVVVAFDVSERQRLAAELEASQARLQTILEQAPAVLGIMELDGTVSLRSRQSTAIMGSVPVPDRVFGGPNWGHGEHEDGTRYTSDEYAAVRALRGEIVLAEPMRFRRAADGRLIDLDVFAAPVRDGQGRIIAAVVAGFDITARRQAERELALSHAALERRVAERTRALAEAARELASEMQRREQAQAALLQAQKLDALGQMTSGIAHDFRNVLTAVSTNFELLRARTSDARQHAAITRGETAVQRADRLVSQLLAFARRQTLQPKLIDLAATLTGFPDFARHSLPPGMRCEVTVAPDIWPVLADVQQLEVALLNLVVNARDAMGLRGVIRVRASNRPDGAGRGARPAVVIAVQDTGGGMPPDVLARAAEPFFTTKGPEKGTGLGLAMVDDFARRSGGEMRIRSRQGEGTVVEIVLPRASEDARLPAPLPTVPAGAVILLADDDEAFRIVTAMTLRDAGCSVVEAGSAEAAATLVHSVERLDLMITDVELPGADGPHLAETLRRDRPDLQLIYITGHLDWIPPDGQTVLHKPFTPDELAQAISDKLRRRKAALPPPV